MPQPYKLFTIYAREDAQYLEELRGQLRPLEHAGRIRVWSDREINPGVDWEKEIVQNLDTADIILILVSAAYYNSAYIHEKEIKYALIRHEKGEAKVLPIIVRPVDFGDDPVISRLQVLPTDGKPVTDRRHWQERDDAWLDVVAGVKRTIDVLREAEKRQEEIEQKAEEKIPTREQSTHISAAPQKTDPRRTDLDAWQQAADENSIDAYETYLKQFPYGDLASAARYRIKELQRKNHPPVTWSRYAIIGGGALALLLVIWLLVKMFQLPDSGNMTQSNPVTPTDENVIDEKSKVKKEELAKPPPTVEKKPAFVFNYPMVRVAGGTFMMGSPASEEGRNDDECQHSVSVGSFGIGKYEVTQAQWKAIMGDNPSYFKGCDDCPVENISWNDIQEFIKKLNAAAGKKYRLPTEEEWEYAARGGSAGNNTYFSYSGGNDLNAVAWYESNSSIKSHVVGSKKPNQLGLYDMTGNVLEWCHDIYKPYLCDNKNTADGLLRIIRGGGWGDVPRFCRSAHRSHQAPTNHMPGNLGFRLAHN